jgi:hypothetical protein
VALLGLWGIIGVVEKTLLMVSGLAPGCKIYRHSLANGLTVRV